MAGLRFAPEEMCGTGSNLSFSAMAYVSALPNRIMNNHKCTKSRINEKLHHLVDCWVPKIGSLQEQNRNAQNMLLIEMQMS